MRVASVRSLLRIKKKTKKKYDIDPEDLLDEMHRIVKKQQEEYGDIFRNQILKEMRDYKVFLISEKELRAADEKYLAEYFKEQILPHIKYQFIPHTASDIFLQNKQLYLAVQLKVPNSAPVKYEYSIVELPTQNVPRFIELPKFENKFYIIFLDDVVRKYLPYIFPNYEIEEAYCIKLTRDAELYFEDEFNGDFLEQIRKAIKSRKTGTPARFLYDSLMPESFKNTLRKALQLTEKDMIPGGRYHNFSDFFTFPNPEGRLPVFTPLPPQPLKKLETFSSLFTAISEQDWALHFPYHSYEPVIKLLEEAANDPAVSQIRITLYRVASNSRIVNALITAAKNKKRVTAFVELMARFDEESNIYWAEELKNAGAKVLYGISRFSDSAGSRIHKAEPKLKVHAKLCLITRTEGNVKRRYAYLGTGNFNEKTAQIYTDHALLTTDIRLTNEVFEVFQYLSRKLKSVKTNHLLVAPFSLRERLVEMIDNEIAFAKKKQPASILLKINSLEDREMIDKLYEASKAGVKITIIVRGICCAAPGEKPFSKNISIISIVGRFLEHGRIYLFHNGGNEQLFLSSADWMKRNLSRRIEVAFPIYSERIKKEIKDLLMLQLMDSVKARILEKNLKNSYKRSEDKKPLESQIEIYHYLAKQQSA